LGYLGGEMLISDPVIRATGQGALFNDQVVINGSDTRVSISGAICAIAAILLGTWRNKRKISCKPDSGNS